MSSQIRGRPASVDVDGLRRPRIVAAASKAHRANANATNGLRFAMNAVQRR